MDKEVKLVNRQFDRLCWSSPLMLTDVGGNEKMVHTSTDMKQGMVYRTVRGCTVKRQDGVVVVGGAARQGGEIRSIFEARTELPESLRKALHSFQSRGKCRRRLGRRTDPPVVVVSCNDFSTDDETATLNSTRSVRSLKQIKQAQTPITSPPKQASEMVVIMQRQQELLRKIKSSSNADGIDDSIQTGDKLLSYYTQRAASEASNDLSPRLRAGLPLSPARDSTLGGIGSPVAFIGNCEPTQTADGTQEEKSSHIPSSSVNYHLVTGTPVLFNCTSATPGGPEQLIASPSANGAVLTGAVNDSRASAGPSGMQKGVMMPSHHVSPSNVGQILPYSLEQEGQTDGLIQRPPGGPSTHQALIPSPALQGSVPSSPPPPKGTPASEVIPEMKTSGSPLPPQSKGPPPPPSAPSGGNEIPPPGMPPLPPQSKGPPPPPPPPAPSGSKIPPPPSGGAPPPPAGKGIPPPPGSKGAPPPPPPVRKGPRMRTVSWNKLTAHQVERSMWCNVGKGELESSVETKLRESFTINTKGKKVVKKEVVQKRVLESNRQQQLGIVLSVVKVAPMALVAAMQELDDDTLCCESLAKIATVLPSAEEEKKFQRINEAEIGEYLPVEQFCWNVLRIGNAKARLQCWLYSSRHKALVKELKSLHVMSLDACEAALRNKGLQTILLTVLAMGNVLNNNSAQGSACGFRLGNLSETLNSVKSTDGRTTLFKLLVEHLHDNEQLAGLSASLIPQLDPATQHSLPEFVAMGNEIKEGVGAITNMLGKGDRAFDERLTPFAESAAEDVAMIETMQSKLSAKLTEVAEWFGESPKDFDDTGFMKNVVLFLRSFDTHVAEYKACKARALKKMLHTYSAAALVVACISTGAHENAYPCCSTASSVSLYDNVVSKDVHKEVNMLESELARLRYMRKNIEGMSLASDSPLEGDEREEEAHLQSMKDQTVAYLCDEWLKSVSTEDLETISLPC